MRQISFKFFLLALVIMNFGLCCDRKEDLLIGIDPRHLIAHRGYWNKPGGVQNSIQSYVDAIAAGFYGAETDVRQTKDGVLVLAHDDTYNQLRIREVNYSRLTGIPTLADLLRIIKKHPMFKLIIEIKEAKIDDVVSLLDEMNIDISSQIIFFSLSQGYCTQLIDFNRGFNVAYLNGDLTPVELKGNGYTGMAYDYKLYDNTDLLIQAKKLGLSTYAWTVNSIESAVELIRGGCDFIITDSLFQSN